MTSAGRGLSGEVAPGVRYAAYLLRCWQDQGVWPCPDKECDHMTELGCLAAALDKEAS